VEEFKYLGTTLTNQNSIQEESKSRLKSGNACYYSMQNLLSSSLLSKNLKMKIYRTIILPVVLYGCETWSLTVRDNCRLRVFENRVLRRIFVYEIVSDKDFKQVCSWGNLNDSEDKNRASVNIIGNIKTSAKKNLGLYEWKQHKS